MSKDETNYAKSINWTIKRDFSEQQCHRALIA